MSAVQTSTGSATGAEKPTEKPTFSERETALLQVAMLSLKSGPPDIDINKFMIGGNFNTVKTAQNTWGTIKKKLAALSPPSENGGDATGSGMSHMPSSTSRDSD